MSRSLRPSRVQHHAGPPYRWARWRPLVLAIVVVFVAIGLTYRDQIVSYVTHQRGAPSATKPYVPWASADQPDLHVAVAGDVGYVGGRVDDTGAAMAAIGTYDAFDVLLLLGDNVYPGGDPGRLDETVFTPFATLLDRGTELLAIIGNHDIIDGNGPAQLAVLGMPGPWWVWHGPDVVIVGLDSNDVDDPDQLAFLETTLAAATEPWKIVAVHHPPYSAGYQGSSVDVRDRFSPVFEKYGVALVLSGHDHDYQRSVEINGVTYVVTGAGSDTRRTGADDFTATSFSWHHFLELSVWPDRIVGRAIGQDQTVADEFVLTVDG